MLSKKSYQGAFVSDQEVSEVVDFIKSQSLGNTYAPDIEEKISYYIYDAVSKGTLHKQENPCWIVIEWTEKDRRRDADNIQSSQKFVIDSLVKCGILQNDNRKRVKNVTHIISVGKEHMVKVMFANNVEFVIS